MATSKSTWKAFEREVAKFFGTVRTALSGGNSKITQSDSLHPKLFIECKFREKSPIWDLWERCSGQAKKEGKDTAILALKKKGKHGFLLVVKADDNAIKEMCWARCEANNPIT